jgi:mannose-6-phosphate isomerase-like protein (cupin superfamily)
MITHLNEHIRIDPSRWYKGTLFQSEHMLVGIDCLAVGQQQAPHLHRGHDKMYYVQSGTGRFTIGTDTQECSAGAVIVAPADQLHAVVNTGAEPLILLIVMAPEPR